MASQHASVMPALDRLVAERAESEDNGPALLNVLHRASFCGDDDIQRAITRHALLIIIISINTHTRLNASARRLQKACHGVLFHYIAAWTVYGRLVDNGNEFFIRPAYSTTGQQEDVSLEEALIPDYLGLPVCRQILFIGKSGGDQRWRDDTRLLSARLVALARVDRFDLRAVEETIHATHRSLTSHFSRWLLHHADLPAHLTVLRDFYLFGHGELYNRFLEQARPLLCKPPTDDSEREVGRLWREALLVVTGAGAEEPRHAGKKASPLVDVRLILPRSKSNPSALLGWDELKLSCEFKSNVGLSILFNDDITERYNELFRFLLRLRRVQMDLERVWVAQKQWSRHPSAAAAAKAKASSLPAEDKTAVRLACLLRLEMSLFADGLLHYIQDVIEVEFGEMCDKLGGGEARGGTDVEEVVGLHEAFLRKLAVYCAFSNIPSIHASLTQIFALSQAFADYATSGGQPSGAHVSTLGAFLQGFRKHRTFVVGVLTGLLGQKGRSASGLHFSGLLLRFQSSSAASSSSSLFLS
ncbi:Spc97 / Spc98 family protein [Acanthamoeba castellanii str. Neff]|uniref:Spindle pole body component n=1 Tax=Acanthamoeba castellanii (strain ATCC 30010 / Neff) TaxID=1257118 RepID=L8H4G4_ACACF|nr:Spc97 / Spc98 family protein [Acanthamoeba castellanii str. Neff]ELR19366.1 Spc97 / Spc98 family protein [Acanthamoeba castellanii str. Neff]